MKKEIANFHRTRHLLYDINIAACFDIARVFIRLAFEHFKKDIQTTLSTNWKRHIVPYTTYSTFNFSNYYKRWEDNIKMDLQEVGGGCGDWMELAQNRDRWRALVSTVMNLRVPKMRGIS